MTDSPQSLWPWMLRRAKWTPASMRAITAAVASRHGLFVEELTGPRLARFLAHPRQEAMWRIRRETTNSLPQIGRFFNRHHTTVLLGIRAHERRLDSVGG